MAQYTVSPEKLQEIQELSEGWGKIIARRLFSDLPPNTPIPLQAMEVVAAAAAASLTEGTVASLLEQQAQTLGTEQPCPDCGLICPLDFEDRPLAVQGGHLTLHEPICFCPDCRRDFFPPTDFLGAGQPQLQPHAAQQDQ